MPIGTTLHNRNTDNSATGVVQMPDPITEDTLRIIREGPLRVPTVRERRIVKMFRDVTSPVRRIGKAPRRRAGRQTAGKDLPALSRI